MKASKTALARVLFVVFVTAAPRVASAQLKAGFTATPQSGCAPLYVSFQDASTGNPGSWLWYLGNGVTSTDQNPATTYFTPGVYTIKLVVYNGGTSDSTIKTAYVTVYQNPVAAFSLSDSTGCFPLNVQYNNNSNAGSGTISSNAWDFGDGNTSTTVSPTHSYTSPGVFSVTLTVTNSYGCTNTFSDKNVINVSQGVTAGFNINAANICHAPAAVNFANTTTGSGTLSYSWSFGDGSVGTSSSPLHNYTQAGNYTVSLKATSSAGCSDSVSQSLPIVFAHSAIAIGDSVCSNRQIQFVDSASPSPASTFWSFGDSTTSTVLNPLKSYTQTGTYTVKVVNTFFAGCADSSSKTIYVATAPVASFTVMDSAGCSLPLTASFTNTTPGSGFTYLWNFGDGTTSTAASPSHQYTQNGSYSVSLTTSNPNGCGSSVTKTNAVVIQPVTITSVTGVSASKCVPSTITPTVNLNNAVPVVSYSWSFGDGATDTAASPSHTYTAAGTYTVKVTIQTVGGCTATYSFVDSVGTKLAPAFTVSPTNVCASTQVTFNNTTPGNSTFLWWYPGDGDTIYKQPNPSHNYLDTGWFSPMLIVMQNGCYDTLIKKNAVHISGPIARYTALNNCINKQQVRFVDESIADVTRLWNFGDGTVDTARNPVHVYASPGAYNTTLFASNGTCTYTTAQPVKVVNETGKVSISDSVGCRNTAFVLNINGVNNNNVATTIWHMGNGFTTSTLHGTYGMFEYSAPGTYTVYAAVTDVLNCVDTFYSPFKLSVYGPTAKLITAQTGGCKNSVIGFTDTSSTDGTHPITTWQFAFGDNSTATYTAKAPFYHTYSDTGYFKATMKVTDNFGCSDSTQSAAIHITQPYASFKESDTLVCPGKKVSLVNTTSGDRLAYRWDFGDGTQATSANPVHLYTAQGIYTPRLYVTDVNNCRDSVAGANISVYLPSAKFLMSDSFSTCPPLTVNFTNQSTDYASYQWSFGDGNTSNVASPAHDYTYPGVYPAKLVVQGNGGCADSAFKNITINGPTGTLQYSINKQCYPFTQQFKVVSQNAAQFIWDFSDGNTNLTAADTASHVYAPGFYVPKLILINSAGCKVPIQGLDTVKVFSVTSRAAVSNYTLCDSGKVIFTDSSATNDAIKTSRWAFGDNTTGTGSPASHSYNKTGTFYIKLTDITVHGCTDSTSVTKAVTVVQSPVVSITSPASYCVPASVNLQANIVKGDSTALLWSWSFGNGGTSSVQNPAAVPFGTAGNYNVTVTATNGSGCASSSTATITVHALPVVQASGDTSICQNGTLTLHATGALTYTWANAPGISCTACATPMVAPDVTTTYSVTGKDQYGCTATDSVVISVTQPIKVSISNSDTLCNGDSRQLTATGAQSYQWFPSLYLSDATTAQPTFFASKDTTITYSVVGYSQNKCFADTATVRVKVFPVPELQVAQTSVTAEAGGSVQLNAVSSPDVTKWKWSPAMWLNNPDIPNPVAQPRESITYTVVGANDGECVTRAQVSVTVACSGANIFVPNTFSPNGDGMNDVFYARGTGLYNIKSFRIFNRWGQIVFERLNGGANNPADGWNGTINGQLAPSDVYVYVIEVLCVNNTIVPVKGNITLIR